MLMLILEAAIRSVLMASAVWAGIRLFTVRNVLAQKVAWVLVLAAAVAMPLAMRAPVPASVAAIRIPLDRLVPHRQPANPTAGNNAHKEPASASATLTVTAPPRMPKPRAGRRADPDEFAGIAEEAPVSVTVTAAPPFAMAPPAPVRPVSPATPTAWERAATWIPLGYLAIAGILLLRVAWSLAAAFGIWLRAAPAGDLPRVRMSREITTPVTVGSGILLPADCGQWDSAKLKIVLAHEQSHVRQQDFYLQLLTAIYAAVFWFSPLGWWLKRRLSELAEALSDHAGLVHAPDAPAYAQVLLEFAAMPRRIPIAGVAMARSSNLPSRIERILNQKRFHLDFFEGRRHAAIAALLVPAALVAAIALVRIAPRVEAAQLTGASVIGQVSGKVTGQVNGSVAGQVTGSVGRDPAAPANASADDVGVLAGAGTASAGGQSADLTRPPATGEPLEAVEAPEPPEPSADLDGEQEGYPYAFVHENGDGTLRWKGEYNDRLARDRKRLGLHGDYLWFERDGKGYVVTDPALLAQGRSLFKGDEALERAQAELDLKMAEVQKRMDKITPEMIQAQTETPEFKAKMAELDRQLAELQNEKFRKMTQDQADKAMKLNKDQIEKATQLAAEAAQERLSELEGRMGEIQGKIGELQGLLGEKQGEWGEKQGRMGEEMGRLGEQMGQLGEQQGRIAEEAGRKLRSILDQAIKDGKAKPVE